ncbi:WEB family protein [Glycine soja]|uniref:WEB family protein n=1 Tax=Glycine soja TaxID=3848 RepID=A0A0B2SGF7_GLYSO|nr:WEB family protein [Glycine soja]
MVAKIRQSAANSPNPTKPVVGEIDTSPPFQSVKDAVSLFGEGAFSGETPPNAPIKKAKSYFAESVWAKERQLHLAQKDLKKLKEQLKNAETTKAQVLVELEEAKRVVEDLSQKLKVLSESRESAIQATEASKSQAKQLKEEKCGDPDGTNHAWKEELETAVNNFASVITELDVAKQELSKIRQGYDLSLEARVSALKQTAEAEDAMKANMERACEVSKEILVVQESVEKMNAESVQAHQLQEETLAGQKVLRQSYEAILEESKKKLLDLKKEFNPELIKNLEVQLTETMIEIGVLQKQIENKKTSDLDSLRSVTQDLGDAKESLQRVTGQEDTLRSMVEALGMELENVKREHSELKEKESKTESIVENLQVELWKSEFELEAYLAGESKARGASEEMILTLKQLFSETENARREIEDMKNETAELKMEAAVTKLVLEDAETKLRVAVEEVEAANAAEASALDQIKVLSMRTSPSHSSPSEPGARITISREEFESLVHKVEESDKLADIKVAAATAQVEAAKASENEVLKRLEETQKEIEDMKSETQAALKRAEMAEAAKRAVEGELRKWREREQKKAAEAASQILAETLISPELSPQHYRIQIQNSPPNRVEMKKLEKGKVSVSKKVLLHNISGIFHRKRNHVEGESSS